MNPLPTPTPESRAQLLIDQVASIGLVADALSQHPDATPIVRNRLQLMASMAQLIVDDARRRMTALRCAELAGELDVNGPRVPC